MVACGWSGSRTGRERSAEICLAEISAKAVIPGGIGLGLHPFRGPAVIEDFQAVRLPIDVAEFHTDAVDWMPERLDFLIDGKMIRGCLGPAQSPTQMMIAVFDFPDSSTGDDSDAVPELITDYRRECQQSPPPNASWTRHDAAGEANGIKRLRQSWGRPR